MMNNKRKRLTNNDILLRIIEEHDIKGTVINITRNSHLKSDLLQDIYLWILEKDNALLNDFYNQGVLMGYINKMISNQFNSKTSKLHSIYRQPLKGLHKKEGFEMGRINKGELEMDFEEKETLLSEANKLDIIDDIINKEMEYLDRYILDLHLKGMSYRSIAKTHDVSKTHIISLIKGIKDGIHSRVA